MGLSRDRGLALAVLPAALGSWRPLDTFLQPCISPFQAVSSQSAELYLLAFPLCFLLASLSQAELVELLCWIPALAAPLSPALTLLVAGAALASLSGCCDEVWVPSRR